MIVLLMSAKVSEMNSHMDRQGAPPKVMQSAISSRFSKIVRLSDAIEPYK
jgi:hypothetical protein